MVAGAGGLDFALLPVMFHHKGDINCCWEMAGGGFTLAQLLSMFHVDCWKWSDGLAALGIQGHNSESY